LNSRGLKDSRWRKKRKRKRNNQLGLGHIAHVGKYLSRPVPSQKKWWKKIFLVLRKVKQSTIAQRSKSKPSLTTTYLILERAPRTKKSFRSWKKLNLKGD